MKNINYVSLAVAVAAVSLAGQAFAVPYQPTVVVAASGTAPYKPGANTTGTAAGTTNSYTSFSLSSFNRSTLPNSGYISTIFGIFSGTNDANGKSESTAFAYDPTNGLRLIGDYTYTSEGAHTNTNVSNVNGVGQAVGTSPRNSTQSTDTNGILGQEAWLYSTAGNTNISIGLTGPNFSYQKTVPVNGTVTPVAFTDTYSYSTPSFLNDLGQAVGTTLRYAGASSTTPSTGLGTSAFLYTPGSGSSEIGLIDANHSYNLTLAGSATPGRYSSNSVTGLTSNGTGATATTYISGTATAYYDLGTGVAGTNLGTDGWVSTNGATPTPIGLYQRGIDPVVDNATGNTFKYYVQKTGSTVSATPGAFSQSRSTFLTALNRSGQVIGTSSYYLGASGYGSDAFIYTPSSTAPDKYRQIGFYSNGFTSTTPTVGTSSYVSIVGGRSTSLNYLNDAGQSVGTSTQYFYYNSTPTGPTPTPTFSTSTVAWVDSGAGPTRIGLYGQAADANASKHVDPVSGGTSSSVTNLTQSGYVGGYSSRYYAVSATSSAGLGQDAWVVDPSGNIYPVDPTDAATGNYTNSLISYLSEDGVAVGQYRTSTTTSSTGLYAKGFLWSLATGFVDLNTSLSPTLTTTGYQNLINSFFSSKGGSTLYATVSATASANVNAIVTLTPEPASLAAMVAGALAFGRRRRRTV